MKNADALSKQFYERAKVHIPGGVNSPVRAFKAVTGTPRFIESARGAYVYDADGNTLIDCIGSWGAAILGHSPWQVTKALSEQLQRGISYGMPCELEIQMADKLCQLISYVDQVRMVNSGTEATMSAIRLARAATSRTRIIKFSGCYHGHVDSLLVSAGSGALTFSTSDTRLQNDDAAFMANIPSSLGVPAAAIEDTLVLPYNDIDSIKQAFRVSQKHNTPIAAVIVEPIAGNMNMVTGDTAWLQALRDICTAHQSLLIFDEVMSGFRVALGGAASIYGIEPDIACFGKVIGGGLPVGAFGGKASVMQMLAPEGPVYQAGTLSGNPLAMCAGLATLGTLEEDTNTYTDIQQRTHCVLQAWQQSATQAGVPLCYRVQGGMFGIFFRENLPQNLAEVQTCDLEAFKKFFHAMLERGVLLAPSAYEAGFLSVAHANDVIVQMIERGKDVFAHW